MGYRSRGLSPLLLSLASINEAGRLTPSSSPPLPFSLTEPQEQGLRPEPLFRPVLPPLHSTLRQSLDTLPCGLGPVRPLVYNLSRPPFARYRKGRTPTSFPSRPSPNSVFVTPSSRPSFSVLSPLNALSSDRPQPPLSCLFTLSRPRRMSADDNPLFYAHLDSGLTGQPSRVCVFGRYCLPVPAFVSSLGPLLLSSRSVPPSLPISPFALSHLALTDPLIAHTLS